jgi:hypothetical protein
MKVYAFAGLLALAGATHAQPAQQTVACQEAVAQVQQQMQQVNVAAQVERELTDLLEAAQQADAETCERHVAHARTLLENAMTEGPERTPRAPVPQPPEAQPEGAQSQEARSGADPVQNV